MRSLGLKLRLLEIARKKRMPDLALTGSLRCETSNPSHPLPNPLQEWVTAGHFLDGLCPPQRSRARLAFEAEGGGNRIKHLDLQLAEQIVQSIELHASSALKCAESRGQ